MKKSKNPNCHCDGSGYWKNPFDQEFKCACNKKKKSKAKGLTAREKRIAYMAYSLGRNKYDIAEWDLEFVYVECAKAARGGKK